MKRGWTFVSVGTGAALMYFLDPDRGRRRRALIRDQAVHLVHEGRRALALATHDLANRSRGLVAEARHRIAPGESDDDVPVERERARIGHVVSHPHALRVEAQDGQVTIRGAILAEEVQDCLDACENVPGVSRVDSFLDVHDEADIPQLSGGARRIGPRGTLRPTPGAQLANAVAGLACALWGWKRGGFTGLGLRGFGLAMLAKRIAGVPLSGRG